MSAPILATKLYIPPPHPKIVRRPRLIERMNEGMHCKLTLISASAGFGKTTLVSEWVAGCDRPVAWVSLDEGDNDPTRFLTYLVVALQTIAQSKVEGVATKLGEGVLGVLHALQPQPPPIESILTALINEITTIPDNFIFVLDDYHVIDAKAVDNALTFLLEHLPPPMHLVIAEGVLPYFEEAQVKGLFLRLRSRFPGCELVSDIHTPFVVWADNIHLALSKVKARMHWSVKRPSDVEGWAEGIRLLEAWNYMNDETANLKAFRIMRMIPGLAKASGIYHYRLGGSA